MKRLKLMNRLMIILIIKLMIRLMNKIINRPMDTLITDKRRVYRRADGC